MKKLTIVVPCYNEKDCIEHSYREISDNLEKENIEYEILYVDDGSTDDTINILRGLSVKNKKCNYISLSKNFGKEIAMYAGLTYAKADYIAIMDIDMQDPPMLLPKMIEILDNEDYDMCRTYRINRKGESFVHSWCADRFYDIMNIFCKNKIKRGARDYCLMKRNVVNALISIKERNRFSKELCYWIGFKVYWIPFEYVERIAGKPKWSFIKLFLYAIDCILNFPQVPVILFVLAVLGVTAFVILLNLNNVINSSNVFMFLVLVSIINLIYNAILVLYAGKIYKETKNRPYFIIRESSIETDVL